ncbi:hypothetical protein CO172_00150 [Candidatus Uhrbacteria bacterium CG_4_9_14_3_um_filter_36_7]|uniref:DUF4178 domain-containing protein n=1 Tax=Candidatus Uhrbacteria bacterium CG_4_9_14_3_um_filter_36_7 TaxID=1975033 RepID=A0A2M7XIH4_9BACT|nr:MAG: hypothetical protein CO172_00150 [Candidatus Uhrbacteria bacterium CG_4_9_14_3_um_filter_36_7]
MKDLIEDSVPLQTKLAVQGKPFNYIGRMELELQGGEVLYWLMDKDGGLISIDPETEEFMIFWPIEEEIHFTGSVLIYGGDRFEFFYEDQVSVVKSIGDVSFDEDVYCDFRDYENKDHQIARTLHMKSTGERRRFIGQVFLEEDIFFPEGLAL